MDEITEQSIQAQDIKLQKKLRLTVPKELEPVIQQYIESQSRSYRIPVEEIRQRILIVPKETLRELHEVRSPDQPFYKLSEILLLRALKDPTENFSNYQVYIVSDSVSLNDLLHETVFI